jgi:arginyl-tRNA--protein-N-Asp/Glu arginylyltransferase
MYLKWDEKTIADFSDENINSLYNEGYVFTRTNKGLMIQTRSLRVDLSKFELSSENRRILNKTEGLKISNIHLPHPNYDWTIHKMGFDFYTKKFGPKTFSANKIKELLNDKEKSNFNTLLQYELNEKRIGYAICFENKNLLHYGYPFYDLNMDITNIGISMMTRVIIWAKKNNKKFVCLGSAQNTAAIYKLQFKGLEWFDEKNWSDNIDGLKNILKKDEK